CSATATRRRSASSSGPTGVVIAASNQSIVAATRGYSPSTQLGTTATRQCRPAAASTATIATPSAVPASESSSTGLSGSASADRNALTVASPRGCCSIQRAAAVLNATSASRARSRLGSGVTRSTGLPPV